jgi:CBS domain-containing protein
MGKSVRDAMTSNPCTIDADRPVVHAAKMMKDENVGIAPVVEGDRLIGTLTDRDIVVRVVAERGDPQTVTVRDEALRLMASHQVRRLPVVEEDGRVVGVLAQADVAEEAKAKKTGELVEEISKD